MTSPRRHTTESLQQCLQDEEASSRFMEYYRSQPLSVVYGTETRDKEIALEHLTLDELQMLTKLAQEEEMEYKAINFQFTKTYPHPVSNLVAKKWSELIASLPRIDMGMRSAYDGVGVFINLRRNLRCMPGELCPRLRLECGSTLDIIPTDHWIWLRKQGVYRPENFDLSRSIVDFSCCAHRLSQPPQIEDVLNGKYIEEAKFLQLYQNELMEENAERVRARARALLSICSDPDSHTAMHQLLYHFPNHTLRLPALEYLQAFIDELRRGRIPERKHFEEDTHFSSLLLALKGESLDGHHHYDFSDLYRVSGLGFVVLYLLESPAREQVLQAFQPEEREKVLQNLSMDCYTLKWRFVS